MKVKLTTTITIVEIIQTELLPEDFAARRLTAYQDDADLLLEKLEEASTSKELDALVKVTGEAA
jgi:hypothetical protein